MTTSKTIAKNASWLLLATTAQKIIAFLSFTVAARIVGAEVTGEYFFAVAITSAFAVIGDLGLTPVIIRAFASYDEKDSRLLAAAFRLKILYIPLAALAALLFGLIRGVQGAVLFTLFVMLGVLMADAIHLLFYGVLRGKQRLQYEAWGMFIGQILGGVTAISAAFLGWGAPGLAVALFIASAWNVGWAWLCHRKERVTLQVPQKGDYHRLFMQALPFGLAGIFVKVYSYLDTIMIEAFHGKAAVGNYAVAYKVTYAFQFIPLVFTAALYPAMSSVFARRDEHEMKNVYSGSLRLMAIVAAPLAAGLSAIAPKFILSVYGVGFIGAVAPLSILPWVLIPIFLDFPVGSLLNASHRAHLKTTAMGMTMVLNAALNALLVPLYGPVGAAWASVGSFTLLFFFGLWFARHELPSLDWLASLFLKIIFVAVFVWFGTRWIGAPLPLVFALLFGGALGVVALLVTKLLTLKDIGSAYRWLRTKVGSEDPEDEQFHA
jgi:O-antigen/teichoic acid export membrane protein